MYVYVNMYLYNQALFFFLQSFKHGNQAVVIGSKHVVFLFELLRFPSSSLILKPYSNLPWLQPKLCCQLHLLPWFKPRLCLEQSFQRPDLFITEPSFILAVLLSHGAADGFHTGVRLCCCCWWWDTENVFGSIVFCDEKVLYKGSEREIMLNVSESVNHDKGLRTED